MAQGKCNLCKADICEAIRKIKADMQVGTGRPSTKECVEHINTLLKIVEQMGYVE